MANPPAIFNLPLELHLQIAHSLGSPLDLLNLKNTCTHFHDLIPSLDATQLVLDETTPYCVERNIHACLVCLRLRPHLEFSDNMVKRMRVGMHRIADGRFCTDCGISQGHYTGDCHIIPDGVVDMICMECMRFTRSPTAALRGLSRPQQVQ